MSTLMLPQRSYLLLGRILSITIVLGAVVMLLLFSACSGNRKVLGEAITERDFAARVGHEGGDDPHLRFRHYPLPHQHGRVAGLRPEESFVLGIRTGDFYGEV